MTTHRPDPARLAALRAVLGDEAAEAALACYPTPERETEAERMIRERKEAERTERALTARETRDELLAGKYGADAKKKLKEIIDEKGGPDHPAVLRLASELAAKERKAEFYRRLNGAKQDVK